MLMQVIKPSILIAMQSNDFNAECLAPCLQIRERKVKEKEQKEKKKDRCYCLWFYFAIELLHKFLVAAKEDNSNSSIITSTHSVRITKKNLQRIRAPE